MPQPTITAGGGGGGNVASVAGSCTDKRVRVKIEGNEIPTTRVEVNGSLDGVSDKNWYADVEFPATWKGTDIVAQVGGYDGMSSTYEAAEVYFQDASLGVWVKVLDGYVRSVGSGSQTGTSRLIIGGLAQFFTAIPFSGSYSDPTIGTVLNDVIAEFDSHTPFSLTTSGVGEPVTVQTGGDIEDIINAPTGPLGGIAVPGTAITVEILDALGLVKYPEVPYKDGIIQLSKNFKRNRHTLKDVMEWLCEQVGGRWYVDTTESGPVLIFDQGLPQKHFYDVSLGQSPGVRVITNDAIQEIVPINAVRINGESAASFGPIKIKELDSDQYPTAKATYDPLVSKAGGELLCPIIPKDTVTVDATKAAAKRALINEIQGAPAGDIVSYGKPDLEPFDHFTGVPVCHRHYISNPPPIEYEVQSVQHVKESGSEYATRFGVRVWVDPDKITVNGTMEKL